MAQTKRYQISINRWDGGLSNNLREITSNKFGLTKHFDTMSDANKLIPYHSTVVETIDGKYDLRSFQLGMDGKMYGLGFQPIYVIDSYSESNYDAGFVVGISGGVVYGGQTFANTIESVLDSIKLYLAKQGSPTGNAVIKIYAHTGTYGTNGVPTGAALATSDNFNISTLKSSGRLVNFIFSGAERITLTAATKYCAVLFYDGGDASNYLILGRDGSSPSHGGNLVYSSDGAAWTASATMDVCFYVYSTTSQGTAVAGNRLKVFVKENPLVGNWASDADKESAMGCFEDWRNCFIEWQGYFWMFAGTNKIIKWQIGGIFDETVITLSEPILNVAQGIIGPDNNLYLFYNNKVVRVTPAEATTDALEDDVCSAIPDDMRIQSVARYGSYLGIGIAYGTDKYSANTGRSQVFIWDMVTDTTVSDVIDWGEGTLMVLGNVEGRIVGVSDKYLSSAYGIGRGSMVIRVWNGGIPLVYKELVANQSVTEGRFLRDVVIKDNKMYWVASIPFGSSTSTESTYHLGIWGFGRKDRNYDFSLFLDYIDENIDTSNFKINSFGNCGNYWFINHGVAGAVYLTSPTAYSFSSIYESQIFGDPRRTKKLVGVCVTTESMPADGQITLKYKRDGNSTWRIIFINTTDGSIRHEAINLESRVATMTIATPAVVTLASHGLSAGDKFYFTTSGALPTGVLADKTYYVIATGLTTNTFQFSATSGGAAVNTSGTQSGTHTLNFEAGLGLFKEVQFRIESTGGAEPTSFSFIYEEVPDNIYE